jgi:hypothetical protein
MGKRGSTISSWLRLVQDRETGQDSGACLYTHIYIRTLSGQGLARISLEKTARSVQVLENNRGNVGILRDRAVTVRDSNQRQGSVLTN